MIGHLGRMGVRVRLSASDGGASQPPEVHFDAHQPHRSSVR